ncbi:thioredoxin family protein [Roseicyclus mahoneyensis]|uniref:Thioredoxin-like protein n=1 Tax=Roseicyclus mahoneyensis TaxID=164332 RepID=A0A316GMP2_9RHOB|nr:thioredoxin family protein [Roseicyclus mahoneyensis]PWK62285.1 thioredoxin-like protein [Roseicyclus mahoneyensis]
MFARLTGMIAAGMLTLGAAQAEVGDDGLHIAPWIEETFLDLREDLAEATANNQRLMVLIEQRGCIYCTRMHEEVWVIPDILQMLEAEFYIIRINMHGSTEVTDFDGEVMEERQIARRWRNMFTPTILFFPEEVPEGVTGIEAAAVVMPGAFGRWTTFNMLNWVLERGYAGEEDFQRYHARMFAEQAAAGATE